MAYCSSRKRERPIGDENGSNYDNCATWSSEADESRCKRRKNTPQTAGKTTYHAIAVGGGGAQPPRPSPSPPRPHSALQRREQSVTHRSSGFVSQRVAEWREFIRRCRYEYIASHNIARFMHRQCCKAKAHHRLLLLRCGATRTWTPSGVVYVYNSATESDSHSAAVQKSHVQVCKIEQDRRRWRRHAYHARRLLELIVSRVARDAPVAAVGSGMPMPIS